MYIRVRTYLFIYEFHIITLKGHCFSSKINRHVFKMKARYILYEVQTEILYTMYSFIYSFIP